MDNIAARLARLGLVLPRPSSPSANYLPWHRTGNLLFIAGQVPKDANGQEPFIGKLGAEMDLSQGQAAAQLCALNLLAHLDTAIGGDSAACATASGLTVSSMQQRTSGCIRPSSMAPPT